MAKSPTANFTTEKNKTAGAEIRTLLEIDAVGGTLYYSDQTLTVDAQAYTANVLSWSPVRSQIVPGEEVVRTSALNLSINNNPLIDSTIRPGLEIRLYIWFDGLATADKLLWFKGIIAEGITVNAYQINFVATDIGNWFDKEIGIPLDVATFPNADPDDIGKIQPILYGDLTNQPCLPIVAGGVSTLDGQYSGGATMDLLDASVFANSGTVIIGEETGTYSGKSTNQLTGVSGISGTYPHGTIVTEKVASLKYMVASHIVKAITNPRILLPDRTIDGAVAVEVANFSVDEDDVAFGGHIATVTLTNIDDIIANVSQVVVTQQPDQPITTQQTQLSPNHGHTPSNVTIAYYMDSVSHSGLTSGNTNNFTADGALIDGSIYFNINNGDYLRTLKSAADSRDGTIVSAAVKIRVWTNAGTVAFDLRYYLNGVQKKTESKTATTAITTLSTVSFSLSGMNWSDFQNANTYCEAFFTAGSVFQFIVGELWLELTYTPANPTTAVAVNENVAAVSNRIADVLVGGGNSVSDQLPLIVDCEGHPDDNPAHYTDVADSLIEEPWGVIHHILENYGNSVTDADIDLAGSFQDAEDNLPASYKFAFSIRQKISMNRLIAMLAQQTWCRFIWEAGVAKLNRIKLTGTSAKSIDTDTDSYVSRDNRLQVQKFQPGLSNIYNDIEIKYDLNETLGNWGTADAYEGSSEDTDSDSITNYKTRQRTWLMFAIADNSTMAADVRDKLLEFYKNPRAIFTFLGWLKHVELERGDTPDFTTSQIGAFGRICEIIGVDYNMPSPIDRRSPELNFSLLDLLFIVLSFTDEAQASDELVIDVDAVLTDEANAGDVLTKIDVDAVLTDEANAGDVAVIDITIPQLTDGADAGDVLTELKSLWYYDGTRKYDGTEKFNSAP